MSDARRHLFDGLGLVDDTLTSDETHDADTLEDLGRIASEWAMDKLLAARALRRANALAEHPSLFVEDVPTGDLV